jgi:hypothetical protein
MKAFGQRLLGHLHPAVEARDIAGDSRETICPDRVIESSRT